MAEFVQQSVRGGIGTITLDRSSRHNSLIPDLLEELRNGICTLDSAIGVRVIVLKAAGPSFSTGGDLGEFWKHWKERQSYARNLLGKLNDTIVSMIECSTPVVVAVDGQVCGGSLGLVLGGDIVVVTDRASFTPYYVTVGFSPDGGWTALLPELIGSKRAGAIQLLNRTITAQQALAWGFVTAHVDSSDLDSYVESVCSRLLAHAPGSIMSTKRLLRDGNVRDRLESERRAFLKRIATDEARDGVSKFVHGEHAAGST